ncbi:hypothetical protein [Candidatus Bartonella washoeensis]|uniref:Uncharacterized protein n=1 Tax=Cardidatus Bartonella washoeensis 085-0475 TaxID=1094564 RepID=J0QEA0_9HYPH|nr:hypothetical protein [Bartonella washoeensis]EJF83716.1 hypothetical protein MCW_01265 [Bartonella washoeensis 085-0475]
MTTDKLQPQRGSASVQGDTVCVSHAAFDTDSQILSFKEAMNLSLRDYIKIFCISVIALVVFTAVSYMDPLQWFHVISSEQMKEMAQRQLPGSFLEFFKTLSLQQVQIQAADIEALWRAAGWNGVLAFLFFLPNTIIGYFIFLFPLIFILHRILNRELNEMIQQLEKFPAQHDKSSTPHNVRRGGK